MKDMRSIGPAGFYLAAGIDLVGSEGGKTCRNNGLRRPFLDVFSFFADRSFSRCRVRLVRPPSVFPQDRVVVSVPGN